ncbi:lipid-A-disaccharide synthase [Bradyrhizobium sp. LHD-71]|nr:lipid-A-disaccharide synthase [Bradyrhizobium sp. LHD-71]MDQ8728773.1 lipid-A-disaccharide synthase [Bradyrhizobium sp. LHD-71]
MAQRANIFLVAAEESGDRLGANLMRELRANLGDHVTFSGVGGRAMAQQGLATLFPIDELSIMGLASIPRKLPMILRRIRQTTDSVLSVRPDVLVIIDSPDFTQRVAKRVRRRDPAIPIVDYVSPTVWAWRPGRARAMSRYVDRLLALLPFEPDVHKRLGGPPCTYVGHPLLEQLDVLRPNVLEEERRQREAVLVVLPGSRRIEIRHHMQPFGETLAQLRDMGVAFEPVLPALPHLADLIRETSANWPVQPHIVIGDDERRAAFRIARAALAKSGTVTLELALSGVPMATAYRGTAWEAFIARRLVRVPSVILANLVLGENAVPEFLQEDCTAARLAPALRDLMQDGQVRRRQLDAFGRLDTVMSTGERSPSQRAADAVAATIRR